MNFDFVADSRFKDLLQRDYQELKASLENKSTKAVLLLSGSIMEASLVEYFLQNPPQGKTEADLLRIGLEDLIILAQQEGLLTPTEAQLAAAIKGYRNLIHPGRQIRTKEEYSLNTADIAVNLLNIILDSINNKLKASVRPTAKSIIEKLKKDWTFRSIYSQVILKLNQTERVKLFDSLLLYEMEEKESWPALATSEEIPPMIEYALTNIKPLITDLKPLLQSDIIPQKLQELYTEIQTGERLRAFALFNFLHEDVEKLSTEDQEMIAIYFLSIFPGVIEHCGELAGHKTYSTIGKYIHTEKGLEAFSEFTSECITEFTAKEIYDQMDVFEQAFNSLNESYKSVIEDILIEASNATQPYVIGNVFIDEARKRGLLVTLDEEDI